MSPIDVPLVTDPAHLAKLKSESRTGSTENLREVARQFESMFTHMLMKNMRAASLGDGAMDSDQSKFYQDMFDQQLSTELSTGTGLGIADLLVKQLGGDDSAKPAVDTPVHYRLPPRNTTITEIREIREVSNESKIKNISKVKNESGILDPVDFVKKTLPHARRAGQLLGVAPQLILAQAALETGWGQKVIKNQDGSTSNNLFGIKAGGSWSGSTAVVNTLEFVGGIAEKIKAPFRSYASMLEGFNDYAKLLLNNPRYQKVVGSGDDSAAFAKGLKDGGYATDPDYATKIVNIVNSETLKNAMHVTRQNNQR